MQLAESCHPEAMNPYAWRGMVAFCCDRNRVVFLVVKIDKRSHMSGAKLLFIAFL